MSRRIPGRFLSGSLVLLAAVVVYLAVTAPPRLVNDAQPPEIKGDLSEWLASNERSINAREAMIPDTEKRIRWYRGLKDSKTHFALVYLPGFSATRQEIAPVPEQVADALAANLFETRLAGQGLQQHALQGVRAEDWLNDAAEALAVGAAIGDRIILMGTSTGATLALAMAAHPLFANVTSIILVSPNFGPKDSSAELMTWPGGPQLAHLVIGSTRTWKPSNELQARYWSTTYPTDALVEMMRLVDYVRGNLPMEIPQEMLVFFSPADTVVDPDRIVEAYGQIHSAHKQLIPVPASADPGNHVITGNIMAPANTLPFTQEIVKFVKGS